MTRADERDHDHGASPGRTAGAQGDAPSSPHDVEIRGFASTLAIAKTVAAAACAGAHINLASIEELRTRLHMVAADRPAFVEAGRQAVDALREGIEQARGAAS